MGIGVAGRFVGRGHATSRTRRLLRIAGVTSRGCRPSSVGVAGIAPWQTPIEDFYLIDTTIAKPTVEPKEW